MTWGVFQRPRSVYSTLRMNAFWKYTGCQSTTNQTVNRIIATFVLIKSLSDRQDAPLIRILHVFFSCNIHSETADQNWFSSKLIRFIYFCHWNVRYSKRILQIIRNNNGQQRFLVVLRTNQQTTSKQTNNQIKFIVERV